MKFRSRPHWGVEALAPLGPPVSKYVSIHHIIHERKKLQGKLAVDVGCGTGSSTRALGPHFSRVVGLDVSETQIRVATEARGREDRNSLGQDNIEYK